MRVELKTPPPRLLRLFELFCWSIIFITCAIVLLLMALFLLLVIAIVVGWIASLFA